MALTFTFDAERRLIIEPGYTRFFSAAELAQIGQPADAASLRQLWCEPVYGTIMMKPLQLQPDFLNHAQQLTSGCVLRLVPDYVVEAADIAATTVFEQPVGTVSNPWIFHTPATPASLPTTFIPPSGIAPFYSLHDIAGTSESGSAVLWETSPGAPSPVDARLPGDIALPDTVTSDLRLLVSTNNKFPANQGFFFRWYYPDPKLTAHQTIYGFSFGQYFFYCRPSLLEIWRDISPHGDRSAWHKQYSDNIFASGSLPRNIFNPTFAYGTTSLNEPQGEDRCLMVIPYRKQHILILSNTGKAILLTVLNNPRLRSDGSDWDITREDTVDVWALTGVCGRFQIQKVKYEPGPATINFPRIVTEYTPVDTPAILLKGDKHYDETLTASVQFPITYVFADSPTSNDVPPATSDGTGKSRTYGCTLTLGSTADQVYSPQFYSLEVIAQPTFMDNPAPPFVVQDEAESADCVILGADFSMGTTPGDGHITAHLHDNGLYPLEPYYHRSECPIELKLNGTVLFEGYSDRLEVMPLGLNRAPRRLTVRGVDKWLLLENAYLRDQLDWKGSGHITVVDNIAMQAGIDTIAQPAEYPAGWNGANASQWDTPLGTTAQTADNQEGNQLLGWKPQVNDTAATFLGRIREFYSGWIMGFRMDGTFYYLPYDYFQEATVQFFSRENTGIATGFVPAAGAGLTVSVSSGTASISGTPVTHAVQTIGGLTDNAVNRLYLLPDGTAHSGTGAPPAGSLALGAADTSGGAVVSVDTSPASGRQLTTSPVYRVPVEERTIEPSGNVIQIVSKQEINLSSNHSALYVDWASVENPVAINYLGRYKWFIVEVAGAFAAPQLNAMAYIVFKNARRRRKRISIQADFVPGFEIGHVATIQGYGDYRLIELRGTLVKDNWKTCIYTLESTERGY
jgi:hypothetical protein